MSHSFTETTTTSWGKRISNALAGIVIGIVLFAGSFVLLSWNEGRSIARIRTLDEGRKIVVPVYPDSVNVANNSQLIHVSGFATTNDTLQDQLFGPSG